MPSARELKTQLWTSIRSDRTVMLGFEGAKDTELRPMTAQFKTRNGQIWFFTSRKSMLGKRSKLNSRAVATYISKNHGLFATIRGRIVIDTSRANLDALWNKYVAAWFEQGKDDPDVLLLRFECKSAEIWLNASSLLAGIKVMLGSDPKVEYKGNVAHIAL